MRKDTEPIEHTNIPGQDGGFKPYINKAMENIGAEPIQPPNEPEKKDEKDKEDGA